MALDVSNFHLLVVADACSIWNVLSAKKLYASATGAGCSFSTTEFVWYECMIKNRSAGVPTDPEWQELRDRLRRAREAQQFKAYPLEIEDLQDLAVLERRKQLSKGELSAMIFAKKTGQAFLTDDQNARELAASFMNASLVQTTPHLLGWLVFCGRLAESDVDHVVQEHESLKRSLKEPFRTMLREALRCRLMATVPS